jgi:hypothetical protein
LGSTQHPTTTCKQLFLNSHDHSGDHSSLDFDAVENFYRRSVRLRQVTAHPFVSKRACLKARDSRTRSIKGHHRDAGLFFLRLAFCSNLVLQTLDAPGSGIRVEMLECFRRVVLPQLWLVCLHQWRAKKIGDVGLVRLHLSHMEIPERGGFHGSGLLLLT